MRFLLVVFLALMVVASGCATGPVFAPNVERAVAYLEGAQNVDGGFPAQAGGATDFATSAWTALAFARSDTSPALGGVSVYLANASETVRHGTTGSLSRVNPISLYVLAAAAIEPAAGAWPVEQALDRLDELRGNETLLLNERLFLMGATCRAGRAASMTPEVEVLRGQLADTEHDPLSTDGWYRATAILALLACGESAESAQMRDWARGLLTLQVEEAGFAQKAGEAPDASTTALVVAVLSKVLFVYSHERDTGREFLASLQEPDGHVRFSKEFDFSPTKTTAEAVLGWSGRGPFG